MSTFPIRLGHLCRLLASLLLLPCICVAEPISTELTAKPIDEEALLALPWDMFDQTQGSGWRVYVNLTRKEYLKAARLIESYLSKHQDLTVRQRVILHYHASHQYIYRAVRGGEGDTQDSFYHLDQAIVPEGSSAPSADWNYMVIATKAFLESDRATLDQMRSRIAELPEQSVKWPGYVDDLIANVGRPYGSWLPVSAEEAAILRALLERRVSELLALSARIEETAKAEQKRGNGASEVARLRAEYQKKAIELRQLYPKAE